MMKVCGKAKIGQMQREREHCLQLLRIQKLEKISEMYNKYIEIVSKAYTTGKDHIALPLIRSYNIEDHRMFWQRTFPELINSVIIGPRSPSSVRNIIILFKSQEATSND